MKRIPTVALAVALIAVAAAVSCSAPNTTTTTRTPTVYFYVAESGDDAHDGSIGRPWRTIQKAVDTASAGSTILVGGGSFAPFTAKRPTLTIRAAPDAEVVIRGVAGVRDVVLLAANNLRLVDVTVEGCRPDPNQGVNTDTGNSGVRIAESTTGVTVSGVTVRDSHGTNAEGQPVGCYGIIARNTVDAVIERCDIYHNGYGVAVVGGRNTVVRDNRIHDNDVIVHNTAADDDDDYGGVGIGFFFVREGASAEGNQIHRNHGPSLDYGSDGGAFDLFASSGIVMRGNTISGNDVILETGTADGEACRDNVFSDNVATGLPQRGTSAVENAAGILLRCAQNMEIAGNHLRSTKSWMVKVTGKDRFDGDLADLRITHNTIAQDTSPVFQFDLDPSTLDLTIDQNVYHWSGPFAIDWDRKTVPTLAEWQRLTGLDASSTVS